VGFSQGIIDWIANRFKVPDAAMQMFKASNEISGIDKKTLPVELIPLNSIQISRGLLNFTVLQSKMNWVFPYWINQQYNSSSKSFVPRSHLGLSMNITHRNWTAVGNMDCSIEPIVDPRGLVTPFKDGWSIDVWLIVENKIFYPSSSEKAEQYLIDDIPVIETKFEFCNIELDLISYTYKQNLYHKAIVVNNSLKKVPVRVIFSIRPFNPEGVSLINRIQFIEKDKCFNIKNFSDSHYIFFDRTPDFIHCSNYKEGDAALIFQSKDNGRQDISSSCSTGLANGLSLFQIELLPFSPETVEAYVPLNKTNAEETAGIREIKSYWNSLINSGTQIKTPDSKINSLLKSSLSSLLMFVDKDIITPGPSIYHQFWFRDAAYMIYALDNFGFQSLTKKIIEAYPDHQTKEGYFRSQKGEWDSNGQAIWTVFQHFKLARDFDTLLLLFDSLYKAVKWIGRKRLTSKEFFNETFFGLLPAGMSAEHLGLADHYFWDNFWSIAGIKAFIEVCKFLGKEKELNAAEELSYHYNFSIQTAIENVQKKYLLNCIPASPSRNTDCGMVGSICASYPLQLFKPSDQKVISTLNILRQNYFVKGLFFQHFIHSGMNPYLTLQIAHSYLYARERDIFWEILNNTISLASPTNNFPEAIHPTTLGGVMGDGHHGWASAELVLAVHDMFILELNYEQQKEICFLQGIPKEWFFSSLDFYIKNAPVSDGMINLIVESKPDINETAINIEFRKTIISDRKWKLILPFDSILIIDGNNSVLSIKIDKGDTVVELIPGSLTLRLQMQHKEQAVLNSK
jgi:hypothetical protein